MRPSVLLSFAVVVVFVACAVDVVVFVTGSLY